MKTKFIILVLLIISFSCRTNNKPVSDAQKEKIKGEVKEVVNAFFKGCEEVNFDMAIEPFLDSPDFVYIYNGSTLSYKDCVDAFKPLFSTQINQKFTIVDEKYAFIDNSTVLYTTNFKGISNFKDGHSSITDPMAIQFIFKKITNKWKVIHAIESSVEKSVINSDSSKGLNQVELLKQYIGTWKAEIGKDTFKIQEVTLLGSGLEYNIKVVTKGKILSSTKALWGYNKKYDKIIGAELSESSPEIGFYALWFTSKNKLEIVKFQDISNPEKANFKVEYNLKSPDLAVRTVMLNNKLVAASTYTYTRVKK